MDHLQRCTGCREVWYCDEMCQKEHWYNTHKKQCKYLSNKKVLSNAKHEEASCLMCKEEARVGKEEMTKQSNPTLPCTMSRANKELMSIDESFPEFHETLPYVALAEMTGVFHTKLECLLVTIMRILVKMKMIKHSLWQGSRTAVLAGDLFKSLWISRLGYLLYSFRFKKPGPLEGQLALEFAGSAKVSEDLIETVAAIEKIRQGAEVRGIIASDEFPSVFQPWGTIKLLTGLINIGKTCSSMYAADCVGVGGVPEEIAKIRTTSAQFNKMRDNVASLLSGGLVPYTRLVVEGLCGENPVQQCHVCREVVNVRRIDVICVSPMLVLITDPVIVLRQTTNYALCGRKMCFDISEGSHCAGEKELYGLYVTLIGEHCRELCDYCGKLNHKAKGHRCGRCKTKLYCGVECQEKDTYHLEKIMCKKGDKWSVRRRIPITWRR